MQAKRRPVYVQELRLNRLPPDPSSVQPNRYALLTGATGLVGQYLMRDLIASGLSLAVVVRPTRKESAIERIERIMQRCESDLCRELARPIVLEGDISKSDFGLSESSRGWVSQHCDRIVHNAAILRFVGEDREQEPWLTNLQGTRHAIELARKSQLKHLHYVSTAYVCGDREGLIYEHDFDCGQGFRNDYERSKFEAEQLVRTADCFDTTTIYRPVVIAGDSETGFTSTYHGLYVYLRLFAMFVPQQPRDEKGRIRTNVQIPLNGDEPRNLVPVQWVSKVMCELINNPASHGKTFHLAPDVGYTARQLIEACYEYFDSHGVEFCGADKQARGRESDDDFAKAIYEAVEIYQDYETNDPQFDTSNVKRFAGHIACPTIDAQAIHRFLDFGIEDGWGKRKPLPIDRPSYDQVLKVIGLMNRGGQFEEFGVRILGRGGGDWTIGQENGGIKTSVGWAGPKSKLTTLNSHTAMQLLDPDEEAQIANLPEQQVVLS